ncbi:hypothetical protein LHP98_09570 [Rhodobacter sp. Har01]|uniref:hypothetical protein n=1 Tax=Rhodobacter sp. Har01 TaxID=2883999 RepID=UPI001D091FAA|nr:hypothetical protein [Rhodobacter sp. Har01]MCB6178377.1 hypothetical protein [Rhodobacter sp. Har01]
MIAMAQPGFHGLPTVFDPASDRRPDAGVDREPHRSTAGQTHGRCARLVDLPGHARRDPLVVYLQLGSAAGSRLFEVLHQALGPGIWHAESLQGDPAALARQVQHSGWISGHLAPYKLLCLLGGATRRPLRLFTLVRRPVDHVAAICAWLLDQHRQGPAVLQALNPQIRGAAEALAGADCTDPAGMIRTLDRHSGVFLNAQARALFPAGAEAMTAAEMRRGLESHESIRLHDEIGLLAIEMTGHPGLTVPREVTLPCRFERAVLRAPEVLAFLARANAADARLVAVVRERAARAAARVTEG